jgi:hypothetical protein
MRFWIPRTEIGVPRTVAATFSGTVYREKGKGRGAQTAIIPIHPEMVSYMKERVNGNLPEAFIFVSPNTGDSTLKTHLGGSGEV